MSKLHHYLSLFLFSGLLACQPAVSRENNLSGDASPAEMRIEAENILAHSVGARINDSTLHLKEGEWASYQIEVPLTGRYRLSVSALGKAPAGIWVEDYIDNTDGRTYDITGMMQLDSNGNTWQIVGRDGSPLQAGSHKIKLHARGAALAIDWFQLELLKEHQSSPQLLTQNMAGDGGWQLVWSDEFNGNGLPDSSKWSYNIGNWGWGNNELQYYTEGRSKNARQEKGHLIIEAHQNDMGQRWTSARLTTQGKAAFTYGKIVFRAKIPVGRGTWAAGWTLGEAYRDEISWPYCGEIDVLECVGYEVDDSSGDGINHATCHTRSYYFKQGNQIGSEIEVKNMDGQFHTYAVEWYPDVIYGLVDGERYFTYDKNKDELEWPFHQPQNIIINLAIGGGWGGLKGVDNSWQKHQYILDYVRVYEKAQSSAK